MSTNTNIIMIRGDKGAICRKYIHQSTMVGRTARTLEDVFTEKQLHHILQQSTGQQHPHLITYDLRAAAEGLTGFLGDHFRVTLHVKQRKGVEKVHLFVKSMPSANAVKAQYIDDGNYFRREAAMFRLFEEMGGNGGPNPWRTTAYLYNERLLVMPDLALQGFAPRPYCDTLDLPHLRLTAASIARFHAAFANYATNKTTNGHRYNFLEDHAQIMKDPTFCDSPWVSAAGKLSANLLRKFSSKYSDNISNLEEKLVKLYIEACDSFIEYKDTINVLIHKDLWANNIMFRYNNGVPTEALLIDFQCLRYGPPSFDLTVFLYLNTSRSFREEHEKQIFLNYYSIFSDSLEEITKERLKELGYNMETFLQWCVRARMFGMFMAIGIFPYVLMDPVSAQKHFDDPETYLQYCHVDRSGPVLEYCRQCPGYLERQLELTEEFVEKYVLKLL